MLPAKSIGVAHFDEETWRNAGSLGETVIYVAAYNSGNNRYKTVGIRARFLFAFL